MATSYLYVRLKFDGLLIFIPQEDLQAIEILSDINTMPTDIGAVGWFGLEHGHGQNSPVFCLSEEMSLLLDVPRKREFLALIKAPEVPVGLVCDEVENINIKKEHLYFQEIPEIMRTHLSPISYLLIFNDTIGGVCTGKALVNYLAHLSSDIQESLKES